MFHDKYGDVFNRTVCSKYTPLLRAVNIKNHYEHIFRSVFFKLGTR